MKEVHYTRKDFKVEWFSGTGKGGQHRNKHQNCCRITHLPTGLKAQGTESRERVTNQRVAFERLARRILSSLEAPEVRMTSSTVIRNYHEPRNEVRDKASGLRMSYREVVTKANLEPMIDARRQAMS